ncbi:FecR domain-containing protein [Rhizobium sp. RHZ01]|uniref:FecR family protein n=1 Tax=Rhizobium sp. RHZ01 TaxID=2769304 RepID=UPI001783EC49|nr:FecR domain-containing protein [Rhizobium sp. RHZ01]MBD9449571.1 FecR domain-containing protein [Rhizobium sp. RHZ01]
MSRFCGAVAAGVFFALFGPLQAFSAEPVGQATLIRTEVSGETGPLVVRSPVHKDERIRTSQSGLGQFIFKDGTKLAVGAGSTVVIDKFVYDDSASVKRLSIKAAKGTFRWISGNSASSAYSIVTPAGTIGVRGTAFDFYVGPNGTTAIVLLNGAASFCGPGGCKQLRQQCDCVVATRGGRMTDPSKVDRSTLQTLSNPRALPFLSGDQQLSGALGGIRTSCGLASLRQDRQDRPRPQRQERPAPQAPQAPQQAPQAPQPSQLPQTPQQLPDTPDPPDKPDKPDHHHHHDRDHHHDWDHHRGWDHFGRGPFDRDRGRNWR